MIKIKKLLTSLAAIGLAATTSSTVVSCVSIKQVTNRKIDTSVYKSTFTNNIQNWNIAATMQSADFKILSNLQDTLLTFSGTKEKPKQEGQILDKWDPIENGKAYQLHINPNAQWFDISTGESKGKITSNDIANTARYTLNSENLSEQKSPWTSIVQGAQDYSDGNNDEKDFIVKEKDPIDGKTGIKIINDSILIIYLNKVATYFPTMLMTGAFAPTPDIALSEGKDYGRNGYKDVLTTGPFYVKSYSPSYLMEFQRNKNYKGNSKGTVNTIKYYYSRNSDQASQRRLWENGDVTESILSPTDTYGEKHYKNFKGIQHVKNNLVGSKYLWFNFSKQKNTKEGPTQDDLRSNMALSLRSVRSLIAFGMNRAKLVQYFAGTSDQDIINGYLTNSFNPVDWLFADGNEYVQNYLGKKDNKLRIGRKLIDEDAYYQNVALLKSEGVSNLQELISKVKKDLTDNGVNGKVTLDFLTSGVNQKTFNPYIRLMIQDFDDIPNNPINIREEATTDDAQYQIRQTDGNFSMFITGETPTYTDPMSYLNDLKINGTMAAYDGVSRLFDSKDNPLIYYGKDSDGKKVKIGDAKTKYNVSQELLDDFKDITSELKEADSDNSSPDSRFTKFGNAEANILYNYKNIIPLYTPNGEKIDYLSYVKPDSRPNVGYGYNDYRLDNIILAKSVKELIDSGVLKENKNDKALVKEN